jgi:hypothetical protein
MVVGITLMQLAGLPYYSPTFARGGLSAVFSCEAFQFSAPGLILNIAVETKNTEDPAFGPPLAVFPGIVAPGVTPLVVTGLKEQVRFAYTIAGGTPLDAVHFNMLAPQWRPY